MKPARTTRYAVAVAESEQLRGLAEQVAGTVRVSARIEALRVRVRGGSLVVSARFAGRGEATRLHLLVHDCAAAAGSRAACEGRPGVHLERSGPRVGHLPTPAERARTRLDLPSRARGALERLAVAHAFEQLGQRAPAAVRRNVGPRPSPRATPR